MNRMLLQEYFALCPGGVCRDLLAEEEKRDIKDNNAFYLTGILQRADAKNQNGRIYPYSTLKREVDLYEKLVREHRAVGECVEEGAKILTKEGWKDFRAINDQEEIYTLNRNTGNFEIQRITQKIVNNHFGTLYRFKSQSMDIAVTPKHRFYLIDRYGKGYVVTAEELFRERNKHDHSYIPKTASWNTEHVAESFEIPGIPRESWRSLAVSLREKYAHSLKIDLMSWSSFLGLWLAEGHCEGSTGVCISQNEGEKAQLIRQLLHNMSPELEWREKVRSNGRGIIFSVLDARLYKYLKVLGNKYTKYIPEECKSFSAECCALLIEWFALGDGRKRTSKDQKSGKFYTAREIFTVSEKLILDLHEVLLKSGGSGSISIQYPKDCIIHGRLVEAKNCVPLNILHLSTTKGIYFKLSHMKITEEQYSGNVYCVIVPNSTFYCMNNGKSFWSMNCDHSDDSTVRLSDVSHLITRVWWDGKDVLGTLKILNTPKGQTLRALCEGNVQLGISSRALGSLKEENGVSIVEDNLGIICWDVVHEPSVQGAFLKPQMVNESQIKTLQTKADRINRLLYGIIEA